MTGDRIARWLPTRATHVALLTVVVLGGAVYGAANLRRGWVPHDEGMIGQSAERLLGGELPHRDFDDPYTGGLTYVNAAAFRVLGENLVSPRILVLAFFVATIPVMYWTAARFLAPTGAAAATALAIAWGLPNYVAAVPSWYNLCFAVFGAAALLRYVETGQGRWLFAAGACGGLSFLAKLVGLYFAAGAVLFLLYREQATAAPSREGAGGRAYSAALTTLLVVSAGGLTVAVARRMTAIESVSLVIPPIVFCMLLVRRELQGSRGATRTRVGRLGRMLVPFVAGFALPIAFFLVPYLQAGALGSVLDGVFVVPARRLSFAALNSASVIAPLAAALSSLPVGLALFGGRIVRRYHVVVLAIAGVVVLAGTRDHPAVYVITWASAATLIPVVATAGVVILGRHGPYSTGRDQQIAVLIAVASLCGLVQFPFAAPIYFCYVAPLLVLAVVSLVGVAGRSSPPMLAVLAAFYLAFAISRMAPGYVDSLGQRYAPDTQTVRLALERAGGLRIEREPATTYAHLVRVIREHAGGPEIWAGPDCPEVYFLSRLRNPTPILFDFFDDPANPADRADRLLRLIEARSIKLVALNGSPPFSTPIEPALAAELMKRFPRSKRIGRFDVRWRE